MGKSLIGALLLVTMVACTPKQNVRTGSDIQVDPPQGFSDRCAREPNAIECSKP